MFSLSKTFFKSLNPIIPLHRYFELKFKHNERFCLDYYPECSINTNINVENYNRIIKGEANNSPKNMDVLIRTLWRVQNDAKTRIQSCQINQTISNMPHRVHMTSNEANNFLEMEGKNFFSSNQLAIFV